MDIFDSADELSLSAEESFLSSSPLSSDDFLLLSSGFMDHHTVQYYLDDKDPGLDPKSSELSEIFFDFASVSLTGTV